MAALTPGTRLGTYEVIEPIGKGGMGEVYRARDTTLGRDVAIKVLPEDFSEDEDRLARFRREAQVLASLNHPNIAAIYGVESNALVLELVEGPTLADLIARGPIPIDEAIAIARQIADALEAAHEAGVIHRDLKPANIKVQEDGTVKVLDFGLAKAIEGEADGDVSESPTMTAAATRAGVIMGTAAYMSPEQARGKRVDRRADIWSFGVVVYEMLTGRRAFDAEDISLTLAEVMKSEPDWDSLPAELPASLRTFLTRCLEKDPKKRVRDIGDVRLAMDGAFDSGAPASTEGSPRRRSWPSLGVAAVLGALVGAALLSFSSSRREAPNPLARFVLDASFVPALQGESDLAITRDGNRIVHLSLNESAGVASVNVRALDRLDATPLSGLGGNLRGPFLSPDGDWVGYFAGVDLRKVSILGGPPIAICDLPPGGGSRGASWGEDGNIVFATSARSGLWRVHAGGGEPEELTTPGPDQGDHLWPEILPGGDAVLFTIMGGSVQNAQIAVLSIDSGEVKVLVPGGSHPRYVPTGHIVYGVGGALRAVSFNVDELEVTSDPVPVLDGVMTKGSGAASFAVAQNGTLAYVAGSELRRNVARRLVWVDREGREEALSAEPRNYAYPRISPDGTRLALDVRDQDEDIWIWDFARETLTRLTFDPTPDYYPAWTPDGRRVAFGSPRGDGMFNVYWKPADGTGAAERLTDRDNTTFPQTFSPDGTRLVFRENTQGVDLGVLSMDADGASEWLLATEFSESNAEISPDGDWLAYQSNASGHYEIYVRPFPDVDGGLVQVSRGGGTKPLWGPDGSELFYLSLEDQLTVVSFDANLTVGNPEVVFQATYLNAAGGISQGRTYDISPDGKRFLMIKEDTADQETEVRQLILVQNWLDELKRLVPVDN